ncbi:hypothetical protein N7457_004328 [Penicillium paradoxum]|uniref:uncharacterized protein n=1 Tax=Penicillium paradoxum TaxID=176176 RepID=UPI002548333A|nr:uncharacterized protein N7457_004328 [Penicillium paradoxum]KAJ5782554.1 hypothetical protein N7457_004328 [Penicillium paradoxum]
MERDMNTPNSTQKNPAVSQLYGLSKTGEGSKEGWGSVEVERGLSILRSAEGRSAVASPEPKWGQGSQKGADGDLFEGLLDGRKKVEVGAYDGFT